MTGSISKTLIKLTRSFPTLPKFAPVFSTFSTSESNLQPPPLTTTSVALEGLSSQSQEKERGRWSKSLLFIPGIITFGLGTWQILRRQEKIKMLDYRKGRLDMEPLSLNQIGFSEYNLDSLEFRKVICEGKFDDRKSIYIGPRSRSISGVTENGYYVISPFIPKEGEPGSMQIPILVNRGWVPRGWKNTSLEDTRGPEKSSNSKTTDGQVDGGSIWWKFWSQKPRLHKSTEASLSVSKFEAKLEVLQDVMADMRVRIAELEAKDKEHSEIPIKVVGVIRGSENPSIFVPENDPKSSQWFYVNIPMIAQACGLPEDTLYIEDINENASAKVPYPVPRDASTLIHYSVMPRDHLNYTITWYTLSAAVTFIAFKRIKPRRARR